MAVFPRWLDFRSEDIRLRFLYVSLPHVGAYFFRVAHLLRLCAGGWREGKNQIRDRQGAVKCAKDGAVRSLTRAARMVRNRSPDGARGDGAFGKFQIFG